MQEPLQYLDIYKKGYTFAEPKQGSVVQRIEQEFPKF